MKKILYFLKDYKKESILAPLFKMLELPEMIKIMSFGCAWS